MYEVLKTVISNGGYKLADIQNKIKKLFVCGDLTEAQMDELLMMAAAGISAEAERPETLAMILTLSEEIEALRVRVTALEGGETPEQTEHPEWKPWDGIGKDYQNGAVVSHKGELWQSVLDGQNVWEPGAPGTENLWVKYEV